MPVRLTTEVLGFPPSARVLLINADDFGMHPAINQAVLDALDHGVARSTSLMVVCPGTSEAVGILHRRPDISFGVHLTLVRDSEHDDWRPVTPARHARSVVDSDGRLLLHADAVELLDRARVDEVDVEFRAQLGRVLDAGLRPTHLDFHSLADGGRPEFLAVASTIAVEHGLALRTWLDAGRSRATSAGLPVVDHPFLDSFSLDLEGKAERYEAMLRRLPAGLTEWAVHPAIDDGRASSHDHHGWTVRVSDHQFLTSRKAADVIAEEGIVVVDYRPLQRVWQGRA